MSFLTTDNRPLTNDLVPRARLELARLSTLDPKSSASANFATSALGQNHPRVRMD